MLDFLNDFYEGAGGWLSCWTKKDKETHWFDIEAPEQVAAWAQGMAKHDDVYFGLGLRKEQTRGRGGNDDVVAIPGVWVDVDVAGAAHKATDLPPSIKAAVALLYEFPLGPSYIVHSGNGLHGYWLFKEPWEFDSAAERQEAAELLERFQGAIKRLSAAKGWGLDSTHDLARILRLPGTLNHKSQPPKPVKIIKQTDARYNPSDFDPYLPALVASSAPAAKGSGGGFTPTGLEGEAQLILDNCAFIQHCRDNAKALPEPEWHAMVTNLARAKGGEALIMELSKPYPGFNAQETHAKRTRALESGHPHTCIYIQSNLGFKGCPEGGCGVKAPCAFALSAVERAKATIARIDFAKADIREILDKEVIGALAVLKSLDSTEYMVAKENFRGRANLNDLERAVSQAVTRGALSLIEGGGQGGEAPLRTMEELLPGLPVEGLVCPPSWRVGEDGLSTSRMVKGEPVEVHACMVPVVLTQRLRNIETSEERIELTFFRDGKWRFVTADRAVIANRQGLVALANTGLPVNSENAKDLIKYFDELERANRDTLPLVRSIARMGWVGNKEFLPGMAGDIVLDVDDTSGAAAVAAGYREEGSLAEWVEQMRPLRENNPIARFMLSASFAAPLLKLIGQRVFLVHAWGPSRGGKTAALKASLSVWGHPDDLMASFNATKVGLERLASFYSDLPLGIDERQVVGDRQGFIDGLVYMIGGGKGKVRGSKGGGLQQVNTWRTIALTTGEQPLSTGGGTAGIRTRTLELYGVPISDEKLAGRLHDTTKQTFGTAGPVFIRHLVGLMAENKDAIRRSYDSTMEALGANFPDNVSSHLQAVVAIALGDFYSSQWIFGLSEEEAGTQAIALAEIVLSQLETAAEADDGQRAYEHFISWYRINEAYFDIGGSTHQRYGRIDHVNENLLLVYPPVFEEALREGGFNPDRILRDWADREWIETQYMGGKRRLKIRKREDGALVYFIGVLLNNSDQLDSER